MEKIQASVIVPTLAEEKRANSLKRCIHSIRASSNHIIKIIVVVNGDQFSENLCEWLKSQQDIHYEYVPEPSFPNAILRGRELVDTPFFATLDDDDEYLVNAIDMRLSLIKKSADIDLVITNGFHYSQSPVDFMYQNLDKVELQPLISLFEQNWLTSNNALYRSQSFERDYFSDYHPYAEWTWLAYRLTLDNKKIAVLNEPTFSINNTEGSLSKSGEYRDAYLSLFDKMLSRTPPKEIIKIIHKKISSTYHDQSANALCNGQYKKAIELHLRSLFLPGGMKYLSYSRKLIPGLGRENQN